MTSAHPQPPVTDTAQASAPRACLDDEAVLASYTRWEQGPQGQRRAVSQLQLSGMHCAACAGIIERALVAQPGVVAAQVNAAAQRLQLCWDPSVARISELLQAIVAKGYDAAPDVAAPARQLREREHRQALWRLFVAAFLMMQVMMLATPIYLAEPGEMSADLRQLLQWGSWVLTLPVMLFSAGPFFKAAWQQLRARRLGMDVPVALGLVVTFVASTGASFEPGGIFGHEVYFDSLTMFVSFLLAGRYLELRARHRVAQSLEAATQRLPEQVERLLADGGVERVSPAQLRVGDLVRVFAGQAFPADGLIEQGQTAADEALLSGEAAAVSKGPGEEAIAGSMNLLAPVLLRLQRVGADTRYEGIVRLMREALTQRPATLRLADRAAGPFLWAVLALALAGALVWYWIEPQRALWVAVSVLIVTCPCALSLAAPSAWLAATGTLARRGVLLARLDVLETLADVDTVVLDKTGTLTEEGLLLSRSWPAAPEPALLLQAAALAAHSRHPVSQALSRLAKVEEADRARWQQVREWPGLGLQAVDAEGRVWRLGAPAWVADADASLASPQTLEPSDLAAAQLAFGQPGQPLLRWRFDEHLRADAAAAIAALHELGLRSLLLSGDAPERAQAMAAQAGVQQARGGISPEGKLAEVRALQAAGHCVLMIGDGINDAPVLAQADASVAMGQGALIARGHADAVLLSGRLMDLALARALSVRTRRVIRQNLAWAAAYNMACIPLALLGLLPPWAAGIGMAASSLFVILNALRLGRPLSDAVPRHEPASPPRGATVSVRARAV
ncbi:cation-translocating P-type ATPase [Paucibacter sp. APW11]|uniref:Cation-translocating P-type ATPase n=1 Tax=Roseateles aquae TaxID=3077235 RepID=A0ABU3P9E9_9BURK|nr:cation-translocating P-type ATPase [Paucibacter sp. APW11]MDT8999179.1 cation-translocating P-type ATPase [Paucibacter sp. APW11]